MTREQVLNSIPLKKRFCKDCNLPINLFDEPYFTERLEALDVCFDCLEKFETFCKELEMFDDEQEYFTYYNTVKDSIITMIQENTQYIKFLSDPFSDVSIIRRSISTGNRNLYIEENDTRMFVSIDMKKANFSALQHYSPEIFKNKPTWEDYVGAFTNSEHIKNSKYIRQVILGACNPKRQITYESYLMSILYMHLKEKIDGLEVFSLGNDEIIVFYDYFSDTIYEKVKEAIKSCPQGIGSLVRCELFQLHKLGDLGWMKEIYEIDNDGNMYKNNFALKGVHAEIYHQLVKHLFGNKITEDDLVFRYNGALARFLKEVDNPWRN